MKKKLFYLLLLLLGITSACSSIDCPIQNTVSCHYAVYNGEEPDTLRDTIYIWTRRSDGQDTLLNAGVKLTGFSLSISYQNPEDTLVFAIRRTDGYLTLDTVWVKKDDIPHFESVDCNPGFFHRITSVRSTHQSIDTIIINHPLVDYDATTENLHISFKTGY